MVKKIDIEAMKKLLEKNNFKEVFKQLSNHLSADVKAKDLSNELIQHKGNYNSIQEKKRMRLLSHSEVFREESQLRIDLLHFIDLLFDTNHDTFPLRLKLGTDFEKFDSKRIEDVKKVVAIMLNMKVEEVIIESMESGSVILNMRLPKEKAKELKELFEKNDPRIAKLVEEFELTEVQVPKFKKAPLFDIQNIEALDSQDSSDEQLLNQIKKGDINAIKTLYEKYADSAIIYLTKQYEGDYNKAATLYNDTFIRVINSLENRDNDNLVFQSYLFMALKNRFRQDYWTNNGLKSRSISKEQLEEKVINKDKHQHKNINDEK